MKIYHLSNQYKGLIFLLRFIGFLPVPFIHEEDILLATEFQKFITKTYSPFKSEDIPVLFLQHGMNTRGIEDPRIQQLAKILASVGYRVIVPEFPEVKQLLITPETIKHQRDCLKAVSCLYQKKIGYIAPSFTGGQGLIAISPKSIQSIVSSILLIGCYSDLGKALEYCLENYDLDNYGLLIFFYNFINLVISDTQNLKNILLEIIVKENNPALVENTLGDLHGYQRLSDRDQKILNSILKNSDYRKQFVDDIKKHLSAKFIYQLSPINFIQQIDRPIFLIHGDKDPVISPKSTRELFQKISSHGISDFLISDLLSHGDVSPSKIIYNLFSLLSIFNRFFTYTQ